VHRCLIVCPGNLVEQWQDEMRNRVQLDFEPITRHRLEEVPDAFARYPWSSAASTSSAGTRTCRRS
jgi:hypothetical protein